MPTTQTTMAILITAYPPSQNWREKPASSFSRIRSKSSLFLSLSFYLSPLPLFCDLLSPSFRGLLSRSRALSRCGSLSLFVFITHTHLSLFCSLFFPSFSNHSFLLSSISPFRIGYVSSICLQMNFLLSLSVLYLSLRLSSISFLISLSLHFVSLSISSSKPTYTSLCHSLSLSLALFLLLSVFLCPFICSNLWCTTMCGMMFPFLSLSLSLLFILHALSSRYLSIFILAS